MGYGNPDRDDRQAVVHNWCKAAFGDDHALSIEQRGLRHVEEAIETAQAAGCNEAQVLHLVTSIFAKKPGPLKCEIGGSGVTLLALAAAAGLSADTCESTEVSRVLSMPLEHFAKRNAAKNAAGFNVAQHITESAEDTMMREWRAAGGSVHGPHVETVTMPQAAYFRFRHRLGAKAGLLDNLRAACGHVEDGSQMTVQLGQDDATREWTANVDKRFFHAPTFEQLLVELSVYRDDD